MKLASCPFCGGEEITNHLRHNPDFGGFSCSVYCAHCEATGSQCSGDTANEALESAISNWNQAGRPGWFQRNVARRWRTLLHDLQELRHGNYTWKKDAS